MVERRQQGWWLVGLPGIGVLWGLVVAGDRLWFSLDHSVPGWDQGGHLTRAMMYWRLVQQANWLSGDWWYSFWTASTKYPPLVYALTVPLFNGLGTSFDTATLINLLFSAILLLAVYGLGSYLFTVTVGLVAALICLVMPGLYRIRLDYLIDYPLVALVTLSFFCLTVWWGKAKGKWQFAHRDGLGGPLMIAEASVALQTPVEGGSGVAGSVGSTAGEGAVGESATGGGGENVWVAIAEPTEAPRPEPRPEPLPELSRAAPRLPWRFSLTQFLWQWIWAIAFGISLGLALLVKQTALLFFLFPLLWIVLVALRQLALGDCCNWLWPSLSLP